MGKNVQNENYYNKILCSSFLRHPSFKDQKSKLVNIIITDIFLNAIYLVLSIFSLYT